MRWGARKFMKKAKNLDGLEGWLILVGIIIISRPLLIMLQSFPNHLNLVTDLTWGVNILPEKTEYYLIWKRLVLCEIISNAILFAASIYLIFLYFSKKKIFCKWYMGIMISKLIFSFIVMLVKKNIIPDTFSYHHTSFVFYRYLIEVSVGIPYMLLSKRVRATFVK